MVVTEDRSTPAMSDLPMFLACSSPVLLGALSLPVLFAAFPEIGTGLVLLLSLIVGAVVATTLLLLGMLAVAGWRVVRRMVGSRKVQPIEPVPSGKLAVA